MGDERFDVPLPSSLCPHATFVTSNAAPPSLPAPGPRGPPGQRANAVQLVQGAALGERIGPAWAWAAEGRNSSSPPPPPPDPLIAWSLSACVEGGRTNQCWLLGELHRAWAHRCCSPSLPPCWVFPACAIGLDAPRPSPDRPFVAPAGVSGGVAAPCACDPLALPPSPPPVSSSIVHQADIWSAGTLLFVLLFGRHAFTEPITVNGRIVGERFLREEHARGEWRRQVPPNAVAFSPECGALLDAMLR